MSRILFLFTSTYPFASGETFIENEMPYLAETFDTVVIISNDIIGKQTRAVPRNAKLERMSYTLTRLQKALSLLGICSPIVWNELNIIRTRYRQPITGLIFKTVLLTYTKMRVFGRTIESIMSRHSRPQDDIYLYSYWSNDMATALAHLHKGSNVKRTIARAHGWDVYFEANSANYLPFRKIILQKLDRQLFISSKGLLYYSNLFPEMKAKMAVSRLGTAVQRIKAPSSQRETFVIVSCSNVIPLKRVQLIAEGIADTDNIHIEWHHFGDGPLFEKLKVYCEVSFAEVKTIKYQLHGRVSNTDFITFITEHPIHVFVNASTTEGIPVSIMEAMSAGIPCIATSVGGTPEIVNNDNGILLDQDPSAKDIAEAITCLYSMQESQYLQKKKAAYMTWDTMYNAERNYRQFIREILLANDIVR